MSAKKVPGKTFFDAKKSVVSKAIGPGLTKANTRIGKRVLVIDDEAIFTMMCKKTLTKFGFEVTAMTDALAALNRFETHPLDFDIVIADKSMPDLDGFELAKKLVALRPNIPIIIASGYRAELEKVRNMSSLVRGYATKPISVADLVAMIDTILEEDC